MKKQTELTETTELKEFKPTPHMIVWLDTAIKSGSDVIDEIGRLSGVNESSYYKWLNVPGFVDWYEEEWNRRLKGNAWRLDAIGMKNSRKDFNYWKAMQQRVGRLEDKPGSLVQVNVQPILGGKTKE